MIDWLQTWFDNHCDSNWEHGSGIKIETIDNPGWSIQIDLDGTDIFLEEQNWKLLEISDNNWIGYKLENNIFIGSGGPKKLELLIFIFKTIIETGTVDHSYIVKKMEGL